MTFQIGMIPESSSEQAGEGHVDHVRSARPWWSLDDYVGTSRGCSLQCRNLEQETSFPFIQSFWEALLCVSTHCSNGYLGIKQQKNPFHTKSLPVSAKAMLRRCSRSLQQRSETLDMGH
ncbi:uncharacterized protein WM294_012815 [Sarcoramphus papa]